MMAYLAMMAPRLIELRRVLKSTGSIYLHCDPTASHYLKLLMDATFGAKNFANEIIWHYHTGGASEVRFSRKHDVVLYYGKNEGQRRSHFNTQREPFREERTQHFTGTDEHGRRYRVRTIGGRDYTYYLDEGRVCHDVWDMDALNANAAERLNYPTQKPEALLERIINASSAEGDVILDPFCGCGTAIVVAQRAKRQWLGIDITHLAVNLLRYRLQNTFGAAVNGTYKVLGEPVSLPDAKELAASDPYQFQWWSLGLVGARPVEEKKGADKGVDGRIYFHDEAAGGKTKQVVLSVKAGKTGRNHVHELRGVLEREGAEIGVLLSMQAPTKAMRAEAASAGFYNSPWGAHRRLQLLTVGELLGGKRIDMPPPGTSVTYKRAPKHTPQAAETGSLFDKGTT
ncbi:hypothetical protein BH20ACT7_BH20ACT7_09180 [soil metagenome]